MGTTILLMRVSSMFALEGKNLQTKTLLSKGSLVSSSLDFICFSMLEFAPHSLYRQVLHSYRRNHLQTASSIWWDVLATRGQLQRCNTGPRIADDYHHRAGGLQTAARARFIATMFA